MQGFCRSVPRNRGVQESTWATARAATSEGKPQWRRVRSSSCADERGVGVTCAALCACSSQLAGQPARHGGLLERTPAQAKLQPANHGVRREPFTRGSSEAGDCRRCERRRGSGACWVRHRESPEGVFGTTPFPLTTLISLPKRFCSAAAGCRVCPHLVVFYQNYIEPVTPTAPT